MPKSVITYLLGIFGCDDQSQMISEAENPLSSLIGLFKWLMYTAFNSSSNEDASSGFGVFGGDFGLKKKYKKNITFFHYFVGATKRCMRKINAFCL